MQDVEGTFKILGGERKRSLKAEITGERDRKRDRQTDRQGVRVGFARLFLTTVLKASNSEKLFTPMRMALSYS